MKICLFGGTFDPPHIGHLIIAETINESEKFNKMIFIPAFLPPHKQLNGISSLENRLEMLRLALEKNDHFQLSDMEIKRGGISYTIQTIREIKSEYSLIKEDIYFLMGSDSLKEFHMWKNPEKILEESRVLVALRPGFRPSRIAPNILTDIRFANMPQIEISSSQIRDRVRSGKTIKYLVPAAVEQYIIENNLYK